MMTLLPKHQKLIFVVGVLLLVGGSTISIGTSTGIIENRINFEGESGDNFSTKTWNPFPPLNLNEGDEAAFYFDMRPNTSLTEWGFFFYVMDSAGQSVKTISRGSAFGGAARDIKIPFIAPYTDTYQTKAYASSAPPNSLQIHSYVSILGRGPNLTVLTFGVFLLLVGVVLLSVSALQKPKECDAHGMRRARTTR